MQQDVSKQQLYWICTQYTDSTDESLVYSAEAGVKGILRQSYLTWDLKDNGMMWLGSQRKPAFQAKDTEDAMASNHKIVHAWENFLEFILAEEVVST